MDTLEAVIDEVTECLSDPTVERGEIPSVGAHDELNDERVLEVVDCGLCRTERAVLRSSRVYLFVNRACSSDEPVELPFVVSSSEVLSEEDQFVAGLIIRYNASKALAGPLTTVRGEALGRFRHHFIKEGWRSIKIRTPVRRAVFR